MVSVRAAPQAVHFKVRWPVCWQLAYWSMVTESQLWGSMGFSPQTEQALVWELSLALLQAEY